MKRNLILAATALLAMVATAQTVQFMGVRERMRYDDGEDAKSTYLGYVDGKAQFKTDYGMWSMTLDGSTITTKQEIDSNTMYGNSGSFRINNILYTVFSHEKPDGDAGEMEFIVRKWDIATNKLLSANTYPKSANLESRGMCYNPVDKKVYGLFYLTDIPIDINELDPEDIQEGYTNDAGYALCTIDLNTMEISQITPGIYYDNFVTLACSPQGKIYSMTSGGTMCEFDAKTGLIRTKKVVIDGEEENVNYYETSGVKSQFKRQAACFDMKTGKMYWNGYVNNGMGYNDWGSYGPLSDKEWRTNGKYDTALYEVDTETGKATQIALIPNRMTFSALWIPQDDDVVIPTDTKVTLDIESFNMNLNTKMLLQATVEPQEAAKAGYTWSSSDEEIATVDELGRISALKAGSVTICATANDGSGAVAKCEINVVESGDVSGDGVVDIADINAVINKVLGL